MRYAIVEFQGSGEDPDLIAGETLEQINVGIVRILIAWHRNDGDTDCELDLGGDDHPGRLDLGDPTEVAAWLERYRDATTVPWFTIVEPDSVLDMREVNPADLHARCLSADH